MNDPRPAFIETDVSLQPYNTFRFDYQAQYFALIETIEQLVQAIAWAKSCTLPVTVLGGGSNLLIQGDVAGLVLLNHIKRLTRLEETLDSALIEFGAGEVWHDSVAWAVEQGLGGIENLALIPGSVGAAPVQNIGAYGVEVKDVIAAIQVLDVADLSLHTLAPEDCAFGYRESRFKHEWRERYVITSVTLRLSKQPLLTLEYGGLKNAVSEGAGIRQVFDAVCEIRRSKLPDPAQLANSGSFFKNPVVDAECYAAIKAKFPNVVAFAQAQQWKLAAGWLNDQAGWKGYRGQGVGVYEKQALVLVNYDCTKADALLALEQSIKDSVQAMFGVELEREPVLLGAASCR
ncbi:UDP-N-acetylenolpyruvoylglucosamine reductase [Marinomonas aquimarina]|uniref:UDP-N-acetylenolpyruvoylglucosamine reductase n=1 Tax=Marinomonas aquimarina TaxID=295068 RepID=A0A1A8THJ2_9GAMM|nr:UDP-N-acetylmuramate dehydrogenase [Marinomonas aquimarina]SBS31815.1 UDP-N-acetylenolpyruvoylglucosamine reductase [Marinomonas aquimarina]